MIDASPALLLPYQNRWNEDRSPVKFIEKSRRIGISYCDAAESCLLAASDKMNTYYISYDKDMTETYISDTAAWAKKFQAVASAIEQGTIIEDDKEIHIFRIRFASNRHVTALTSKPRNLRSKQGRVVWDEAAFSDDPEEMMKAAVAFIMWGGQVEVISTHNGEDNAFNQNIQDIRAGRKKYSLHRVTLDDALAEGLYQRICLVKNEIWTPKKEEIWRKELIDFYGDDADEELFCIPSKGTGQYLTRAQIEACMRDGIPVVRYSPPSANFVDWDEAQRVKEIQDWCEEVLSEHVSALRPELRSFVGEDFGRTGDLSVIWPLQEMPNLVLTTPFLLELRNVPFECQKQIFFYICDRLPRFSGGALDARGNGQYLAEVARQRYGPERIIEVMLSEVWYRENMPRFKDRIESKEIIIPKDSKVLDDLRSFKMVKGVAKVPESGRVKKDGEQRHGDAGIAAAIAVFASLSEFECELAVGSI
jgi:phage FluMu gp28-like protein